MGADVRTHVAVTVQGVKAEGLTLIRRHGDDLRPFYTAWVDLRGPAPECVTVDVWELSKCFPEDWRPA